MSNIVIKQYNGIDIPFGKGENVWLNATKAAEVFGKRPGNFFQTETTFDYLNALAEALGCSVTEKTVTENESKFSVKELAKMFPQFIQVRHGNGNAQEQGTWISKELVINYSRWLDAKFAVWCDIQIRELLENGSVSLAAKLPTNYAAALRELADTVEEKIRLELENKELQTKADFHDFCAQSDDEIDMGEAAKILNLGFGSKTLFKRLREMKVLMADNIPYQRYVDLGYFRCVEQPFTDAKGKPRVNVKTVVLQKGVAYLISLFKTKALAA